MVNLRLDNGEFITVCETETEWEMEKKKIGNTIIYHPQEIKELKGLDKKEVVQIHEAKKIFDGFLGGAFPKKQKAKSSLSEMRKKCQQKKR